MYTFKCTVFLQRRWRHSGEALTVGKSRVFPNKTFHTRLECNVPQLLRSQQVEILESLQSSSYPPCHVFPSMGQMSRGQWYMDDLSCTVPGRRSVDERAFLKLLAQYTLETKWSRIRIGTGICSGRSKSFQSECTYLWAKLCAQSSCHDSRLLELIQQMPTIHDIPLHHSDGNKKMFCH